MIKNHNFYLIITNTALNLLKFKKDCVILYKMKANYIRKIIVGILATLILTFSLSGCEIFGMGGDGSSAEPAVYISQSDISLAVGDIVQLSATSTDGSEVTWESSNSAVATVVDGLVTGVGKGDVIIMASTASVMAVCNIKVNDAPNGSTADPETLVLSLARLNLEVGNSVTLIATSSIEGAQIIWDSTNKTVATVSEGKVTAKTVGKTTITVTTGTAIASCEIIVTEGLPENSYKDGYELIWYDEFKGTSLDTTKWSYQTGTRDIYHSFDTQNLDWGNQELQYYTEDSVKVSGGNLVITATKQSTDTKEYKSGRILTRDKAKWTFGYFEARMKTPTGNGMWPAFWMLPQPSNYSNITNKYGGWPYNGEIDIMEAKGSRYNKVDTTLHFGPYADGVWDSQFVSKETTLSSNTDQWHTYAVDWTADKIVWYVDGTAVQTVTNETWYSRSPAAAGNASAPFDQPFYILLNLAVGGKYDNGVGPDASFTSKSMYVDYVRVYRHV